MRNLFGYCRGGRTPNPSVYLGRSNAKSSEKYRKCTYQEVTFECQFSESFDGCNSIRFKADCVGHLRQSRLPLGMYQGSRPCIQPGHGDVGHTCGRSDISR